MILYLYNLIVRLVYALHLLAKPLMRHDSKPLRFLYGRPRGMYRQEAIKSDLSDERIGLGLHNLSLCRANYALRKSWKGFARL